MSWLRLATRLVLGAALGAAGCTPKVGDRCSLNTDCSIDNTRVCDNSQPGGYCTVVNCAPNSCPNNAACVAFQATVPGCPYDDYASPARTARTFCMETCKSDSDCRQSDGYVCRDPSGQPWAARIVDSNYARQICLLPPDRFAAVATRPASACPDGVVPKNDGGTDQDGSDAGVDGNPLSDVADAAVQADASIDAQADASIDAGVDASTDALGEAFADAMAFDADGGG
jgi:hypothetical protein